MKAFVLAAGFGKRMGRLTERRPKPLLPVGGYPLLCHTLFLLHRWGISEVIINVHYLADQIVSYLEDFPHFPVQISHEEEAILGSAGGVRLALPQLGSEPFLLINPDQIIVTADGADSPVAESVKPWFPNPATADATLYVLPHDPASGNTAFAFASASTSTSTSAPIGDHVARLRPDRTGGFYYIGCAVFSPRLFADLPLGEFAELLPLLENADRRQALFGRVFPGIVRDAGTETAYAAIQGQPLGGQNPDLAGEFERFVAGWRADRF